MEIGMKMVLFWGGIFVAQYICLNPEGGKSMSYFELYMGVSKNRGTPKWMVKIMEHPIKMDDLGVPLFLETPI